MGNKKRRRGRRWRPMTIKFSDLLSDEQVEGLGELKRNVKKPKT